LQVFLTKFVVKSVLYKIFCKKIGSNFLQTFFATKFVTIFYEKNFKAKLVGNMSFFSSEIYKFKGDKIKFVYIPSNIFNKIRRCASLSSCSLQLFVC